MLNFKAGYSHIWNQYAGGTGEAHIDLGIGLQYRFSKRMSIYFQSGIMVTQEAFFSPLRFGLRF